MDNPYDRGAEDFGNITGLERARLGLTWTQDRSFPSRVDAGPVRLLSLRAQRSNRLPQEPPPRGMPRRFAPRNDTGC
jgi:hypothetical protein